MPEGRRLVLALGEEEERRAFRLGWSRWRRAHQALAQRGHVARRRREREADHLPAPAPSVRAPLASAELTDAAWERVRPLLPPQKPPVGRPRQDQRTILGGLRWVLRTAAPWREMPARFGKWDTAYARYRLWRKQGLWPQIIEALGPAPSRAAPDSAAA